MYKATQKPTVEQKQRSRRRQQDREQNMVQQKPTVVGSAGLIAGQHLNFNASYPESLDEMPGPAESVVAVSDKAITALPIKSRMFSNDSITTGHTDTPGSSVQQQSMNGMSVLESAQARRSDQSVQLNGNGDVSADTIHEAAGVGIRTPSTSLPYARSIQASFGRHDISGIQFHDGPVAAQSARNMNAEAYTSAGHVVSGRRISKHTAAHEAAHYIQQRGGIQLKGGVGSVGDKYERHADAVADAVVRGRSAEALLDRYGYTGSHTTTQESGPGGDGTPDGSRRLPPFGGTCKAQCSSTKRGCPEGGERKRAGTNPNNDMVQRNVGLEFQTSDGEWNIKKRYRKGKGRGKGKGQGLRRISGKRVIHTDTQYGWKLTNDGTDLEYITDSFDDDSSGIEKLVRAAKSAGAFHSELRKNLLALPGWTEEGSIRPRLYKNTPEYARGDSDGFRYVINPKGQQSAHPQATIGLKLDRLCELASAMGNEGLTDASVEVDKAKSSFLEGVREMGWTERDAGSGLQAVTRDAVVEAGLPVYNKLSKSGKSFLFLVLSYVLGTAHYMRMNKTDTQNAKNALAFMSRTNFVSMKSLLTEEDMILLNKVFRSDDITRKWTRGATTAPKSAENTGMNPDEVNYDPAFVTQYDSPGDDPEKALTLRKWWGALYKEDRDLTAEDDKESEKMYHGLGDTSDMKDSKGGSIKSPVDIGSGRVGVILELRKLKSAVDPTNWWKVAQGVANAVNYLNTNDVWEEDGKDEEKGGMVERQDYPRDETGNSETYEKQVKRFLENIADLDDEVRTKIPEGKSIIFVGERMELLKKLEEDYGLTLNEGMLQDGMTITDISEECLDTLLIGNRSGKEDMYYIIRDIESVVE